MVGIRFSDFITEEFYNTFRHKTGRLSEVFKNPTSDEIADIMAKLPRTSYLDIKGLLIGDDFYIWTGEHLHEDMAKSLNFYGSDIIPLYPEPHRHKVFVSTTMMHGHGFTTLSWEHQKKQIIKTVKNHPALKVLGGFTVDEQ
jgi:hypothetical protein